VRPIRSACTCPILARSWPTGTRVRIAPLAAEEDVTIKSQLVGTTIVLRVHGTLTTNAGERGLREVIREAVADGTRIVVVNLEDATTIDSSGVSDLASGHKVLAKNGGALKLCCLSKKLKDILVITRLDAVFETYGTEAEALASAESP
jgi:anti-sigma B factor antagonist